MGLLSKIKEKWNKWYYHEEENESEDWEEEEEQSESYFEDADNRTVYVLECLGQMAEAAEKKEQYQEEYDAVTGLLMDTDEIDDLPYEQRSLVTEQAKRIEHLEKERRRVYLNTGHLSESRFNLFSRYEDAIPGAIRKIRDEEEYRKLIKMDLRKLDADRNSCRFQMRESRTIINNSRGVAGICAFAVILSVLLLLLLQYGFRMNVVWGYLIICAAGAITLTVLFIRYQDAVANLKMLEKLRNKQIGLHNTVKIRYVNNTNLLQYLYNKYEVESADELAEDWRVYVDEINARHRDEQIQSDLEYYYDKLTKTLKDSGLRDPDIWIRQTPALVDPREMVEVRHALIARRQKLRERLEYNKDVAENAQKKIKDLVSSYPQYAEEVGGIVARYDGKNLN